jgi:N-formylglutamate deformylase
MIEVLPGVWRRHAPAGRPAPLLFDVPRSGTCYPPGFHTRTPFHLLHASVSSWVDELCSGAPAAGATLLVAEFPNSFVDANRDPRDLDPDLLDGPWPEPLAPSEKSRAGMGLVRRLANDGTPLYDAPLPVAEVRHRIEGYHAPYHATLAATLEGLAASFGGVVHVSGHCMGAIGNALAADRGARRPDFCIGDRHGSTCAPWLTDFLVEHLAGLGYRVTRNDPYAGAFSVARHGAPANGVHSVQIEMNKALYMDEEHLGRTEGFAAVRNHLDGLARALAREALSRFPEGPP